MAFVLVALVALGAVGPASARTRPNPTGATTETQLIVQLREDVARARARATGSTLEHSAMQLAGDVAARVSGGLTSRQRLRSRATIQLFNYSSPHAAAEALAALRADDAVLYAESNGTRQLAWAPTDAAYPDQEWWIDQIDGTGAWGITTGSPAVVVAVIDSGVSPTHPDLVERLVGGYNAVDGSANSADIDGHGTHVAGIIAAQGSNGVGTAGVAMDVRIMPIRVMADDFSIDIASEIDAIYWAVDNGADVINLSLGSEQYSQIEREAIRYARDSGVVVVAAAGNTWNKINYPAQYDETISVGALAADGMPSSFTSRLTRVDIAAPGESIFSPGWDSFYGDYWDDVFYSDFVPVSGTSFAAPIVSGVVALMKSVDPSINTERARTLLTSTAVDSGAPGRESGTGAGRVSAEAAVRMATYSAMDALWNTTDSPVAGGAVNRTWLWGEGPLLYEYESYSEAQNGLRLVYYFDKSRMEVTDPLDDRNQAWYVTNGLLVREMISGRLQLGDNSFSNRGPAAVNVAGDPDDPLGPRYSSFTAVQTSAPLGENALITQTINRAGSVGSDSRYGGYGVRAGPLIPETNHRVASVFWSYLNSTGIIAVSGGLSTGRLFDPWFYATGLPITEAYWARVKVANVYQDVLIQCFERRCLTYTPSNAAGWQVEMGNVGRHYYQWRYGAKLPE
ncbi:MAG: peptidase S8 [Chloroflexi bacterium]|nr:MAG: peptidase S8 [Chloroflexota bacterium]